MKAFTLWTVNKYRRVGDYEDETVIFTYCKKFRVAYELYTMRGKCLLLTSVKNIYLIS